MKEIIEELKGLCIRAKDLIDQYEKKLRDLDQRQTQLDSREAALSSKESAFADREASVVRIENIVERERQSYELSKKAREEYEILKNEKQSFDIWKEGERKRIAAELKAIDQEWKKIRGES